LLQHFPESGLYYLPANQNPPALRTDLYEQGPTGFVFIQREGRPGFDGAIMLLGFFHNLLVALPIAFPLGWELAKSFYDFVAWVIAAAILACFIRGPEPARV